ncbi:MAG: hypothetical protein NZM04_10400 [Methylacidiphilales bacterium]|nr:hypothetical protein [Candidatus Methylacidiphilales bacterium]
MHENDEHNRYNWSVNVFVTGFPPYRLEFDDINRVIYSYQFSGICGYWVGDVLAVKKIRRKDYDFFREKYSELLNLSRSITCNDTMSLDGSTYIFTNYEHELNEVNNSQKIHLTDSCIIKKPELKKCVEYIISVFEPIHILDGEQLSIYDRYYRSIIIDKKNRNYRTKF